MKEIIINNTGKTHLRDGQPCQDAYFADHDSGVYVLADGVSNEENGGRGAKVLCLTLGKLLSNNESKHMLAECTADEIRAKICLFIDRVLDALSKEHGADRDSFASTLLAFVQTSATTACLLHAGDGCIFALPNTEQQVKASVLSYPDNDIAGHVYQAGHPEQKERLRVLRINLTDFSQILLATDGFSDAYLMSSFQGLDCEALTEVFCVETKAEMQELIKKHHYNDRQIGDDISCVLLKNKQSASIATEAGSTEEIMEDTADMAPSSYFRLDTMEEVTSGSKATDSSTPIRADCPTESAIPISTAVPKCHTNTAPFKEKKTDQNTLIESHPGPFPTPRKSSSHIILTALVFAFSVIFAVFAFNRLSQLNNTIDEQKSLLADVVSDLQSLVDEQQTAAATSQPEKKTGKVVPQQTTDADNSKNEQRTLSPETSVFSTADTTSETSVVEDPFDVTHSETIFQEETVTVEMLVG